MAEVRDKLLALGIVASGGTVDAVQVRIPAAIAKWAGVIKTGNLRFD